MNKRCGVCVVDDDFASLESMSFMLRRMGFSRVEKFLDPEAAWDYIRDTGPSLVVSDWDMGSLTGIELLERVRCSYGLAATPFILVTGNTAEDYWKRAIEADVSEFLFKPLSLKAFEGAVDFAMSQSTRTGVQRR